MMESLTNGKVTLSPLAVIVIGLVAPFIGSVVRDRIDTGGSTATTTAEVKNLDDALKAHLSDSVHRSEFTQLQQESKGNVSQEQFNVYSKAVDSRLDSIKEDLKDIKEGLRAGKR